MGASKESIPDRGARCVPGATDIDSLTVRSLARLTGGDPSRFAHHEQPPESIQQWIDALDLRQTHALIIHALRRWHTLGGDD